MPPQTHATARPHAIARRWIAAGVGEVLLLTLLAAFAYFHIFSTFVLYDDEGYMMLTVKHFLANHPLYDQVWTIYGPVYFVYKWVVHGLFALPLTDDVVRLTALVTWLSTGVVAALAVVGLTDSLALAAVTQLVVTGHLATIGNEPGHPQELAGLLTMAIVAVPAITRGRRPRRTLVAVGLMVAALTMTKVNLGIFIALAIWMSLLSVVPLTVVSGALRAVFAAALVTLPGLLMRPLLKAPWAWHFAATEAMSIVAVSTIALTRRRGVLRLNDLVAFAWGGIGGVLLIALTTLAKGTSFAALLDCLIAAPARLPTLLVEMPASYCPAPIAAVGAIAFAVGVRATQRWRAQPHVLGLAKLAFGIAALSASWQQDIRILLPRLTPFLWLALLPVDEQEDAPPRLARFVLCWAAVLQPLQAYPVAGSQAYFGTVLHVLVGAVCVGDGVSWLRSLSAVLDRRELRAAAAGAALLVVASLSVTQLGEWRKRYTKLVPLDLPGTTRLRMLPKTANTLRTLTQTLRERSDTFLCVPGFSSLYFWTGEEPPTLDVLGHNMRFYSEERQAAMVRALLEHPRPMVVDFRGVAPRYPPFEARLSESFKPLMQVGRYQLLVPR